jgi:pimeloyl-ACP methyl ester carboxylesterase
MKLTKSKAVRRIAIIVIGIVAAVGLFIGGKSLRNEYYPVQVDPSSEWEPFISSLDVRREAFFVVSNGTKLEAELFIPKVGAEKKPAVIFSPGSGDALYQNYAFGLVERYILKVFLTRDMAVLLVNKRGMGLSEGDYTRGSIEARAFDIYSAVQSIQSHPDIDDANIGLVGHSEGGWVVTQAAADHPDIAFFVSLAGPTTTRMEQATDMYAHEAVCDGLVGEKQEDYLKRRIRMTRIGTKIGEWTNFGLLGFDSRTMHFDPRNAIQTIQVPALFIYAENDILVTPALHIERMNEIFGGDVPEHIEMTVIDGATHGFRLVESPCESRENPAKKEWSEQLTATLHTWLAAQGY